MNRVVIECKGRLANCILCWANAVHVFAQLGIKDRVIAINYPDLSRAVFPAGTQVEIFPGVSALPRVTRNEIAQQPGDCVWAWEDVYSAFPDASVMNPIIRSMRFPGSWFEPSRYPPQDCVGIHVRYGDYVEVDPANPPVVSPPFIRAPNDYFLMAVRICRALDPLCTFFVASDGTNEELAFLRRLPGGVVCGKQDDPLSDLFTLSQCRLIIGSNSTFSNVAAAYGDVPLTLPGMCEADLRAVIEKALK